MDTQFYRTHELAAILGLRPGTLEIMRCQGRGPTFVKFGRAVRYRKADIERWIEEQSQSSTAENRRC
jgi:predicted DNA-binding transcriptional regulator AlpA